MRQGACRDVRARCRCQHAQPGGATARPAELPEQCSGDHEARERAVADVAHLRPLVEDPGAEQVDAAEADRERAERKSDGQRPPVVPAACHCSCPFRSSHEHAVRSPVDARQTRPAQPRALGPSFSSGRSSSVGPRGGSTSAARPIGSADAGALDRAERPSSATVVLAAAIALARRHLGTRRFHDDVPVPAADDVHCRRLTRSSRASTSSQGWHLPSGAATARRVPSRHGGAVDPRRCVRELRGGRAVRRAARRALHRRRALRSASSARRAPGLQRVLAAPRGRATPSTRTSVTCWAAGPCTSCSSSPGSPAATSAPEALSRSAAASRRAGEADQRGARPGCDRARSGRGSRASSTTPSRTR